MESVEFQRGYNEEELRELHIGYREYLRFRYGTSGEKPIASSALTLMADGETWKLLHKEVLDE